MGSADYLLKEMEKKFHDVIKNVQVNYTDDQIEEIIRNIISGQLYSMLANHAHSYFMQHANKLIEEEVDGFCNNRDVSIIVGEAVKAKVYTEDFQDMVATKFKGWLKKKLHEENSDECWNCGE